jgi:hypothetical protein
MKNFLEVSEVVLESLGTNEFFGDLGAALERALNLEFSIISCVSNVGTECPYVLYETAGNTYADGLRLWASKTYLLYPSYKAIKSGTTLSTHTEAELYQTYGKSGKQPDAKQYPIVISGSEEIGFYTKGFSPELCTLVCFLNVPSLHQVFSCVLVRKKSPTGTGFDSAEIESVEFIRPLLNRMLTKHIEMRLVQTSSELQTVREGFRQDHAESNDKLRRSNRKLFQDNPPLAFKVTNPVDDNEN